MPTGNLLMRLALLGTPRESVASPLPPAPTRVPALAQHPRRTATVYVCLRGCDTCQEARLAAMTRARGRPPASGGARNRFLACAVDRHQLRRVRVHPAAVHAARPTASRGRGPRRWSFVSLAVSDGHTPSRATCAFSSGAASPGGTLNFDEEAQGRTAFFWRRASWKNVVLVLIGSSRHHGARGGRVPECV